MNFDTIYFGDYEVGIIISNRWCRYVLNPKIFDVLTFQYKGLRYTDKESLKVLWI